MAAGHLFLFLTSIKQPTTSKFANPVFCDERRASEEEIIGIQKEMKSPTSERGGSNRNTKGDEIADERARSEEQNPQRGFCDERRASEEEARLLNIFI